MSFSVPTVNGFVFCARFFVFHMMIKILCRLKTKSLLCHSSDSKGGNFHLVAVPATSSMPSVVAPVVLGEKVLLFPRSQSSVIFSAPVIPAVPVHGPLSVAPIGMWPPNVVLLASAGL